MQAPIPTSMTRMLAWKETVFIVNFLLEVQRISSGFRDPVLWLLFQSPQLCSLHSGYSSHRPGEAIPARCGAALAPGGPRGGGGKATGPWEAGEPGRRAPTLVGGGTPRGRRKGRKGCTSSLHLPRSGSGQASRWVPSMRTAVERRSGGLAETPKLAAELRSPPPRGRRGPRRGLPVAVTPRARGARAPSRRRAAPYDAIRKGISLRCCTAPCRVTARRGMACYDAISYDTVGGWQQSALSPSKEGINLRASRVDFRGFSFIRGCNWELAQSRGSATGRYRSREIGCTGQPRH